ncbi:hypothetical protein C8Q78DRAFT_308447 [Trametes maxima]|nr:hypothetical protein C8Q78DRAFT_308447 [Trametes maxima]
MSEHQIDNELRATILDSILALNAMSEVLPMRDDNAFMMQEPKTPGRPLLPAKVSSPRNRAVTFKEPEDFNARTCLPKRLEPTRERFVRSECADKENHQQPLGLGKKTNSSRRARARDAAEELAQSSVSPFARLFTTPRVDRGAVQRIIFPRPAVPPPLREQRNLQLRALPPPKTLRYAPHLTNHRLVRFGPEDKMGAPVYTFPRLNVEKYAPKDTAKAVLASRRAYLLKGLGKSRHRFEVVVRAQEFDPHPSYWYIQPCPEDAPAFNVDPASLQGKRPLKRARKWETSQPLVCYVLDKNADLVSRKQPLPNAILMRDQHNKPYTMPGVCVTHGKFFVTDNIMEFKYQKPPRLSFLQWWHLSREERKKRKVPIPDPRAIVHLWDSRQSLREELDVLGLSQIVEDPVG